MTAHDVVKHFGGGSVYEAAKALDVRTATIYQWMRIGIPDGRQAMIELRTKGKLKAGKRV